MKYPLRGLGTLGILVGAFLLHSYFPATRAQGWDDVRTFGFEAEVCAERLRERESVVYTHGDDPEPATWGELAGDFNLETTRICLHNGESRRCDKKILHPGDTLELPLALDAPEGSR